MGTLTTPDFWDCACEAEYIRQRSAEPRCTRCGMEAADAESPDSRIGEVRAAVEVIYNRATMGGPGWSPFHGSLPGSSHTLCGIEKTAAWDYAWGLHPSVECSRCRAALVRAGIMDL